MVQEENLGWPTFQGRYHWLAFLTTTGEENGTLLF